MTNARLLPMTVALMPYLRHRGTPTWRYYLFANHVAVTAWAASMRVCPRVPTDQRLPYFAAFGTMLWSMCLVTTAVGFYLAVLLPGFVTLGLVFRSEEHTSELQSLMRISYAVFCLKKKKYQP